jgi:tetraacyldisaccharide 4'-kinase
LSTPPRTESAERAERAAQREAHWRRVWASRAWPAWGWWPLSQLYRSLLALRRAGYALGWLQATRVPCPVLVVGNVIVGGAGKTPTTIALVQHLQARGLRVGVVSRGHGGTHQSTAGAANTRAQLDDVAQRELGLTPSREADAHDADTRRANTSGASGGAGDANAGGASAGTAPTWLAVTPSSSAAQVGDEPLLIHLRTGAPVFVARQRAQAAQALLAAHPDTQLLLCDDGLQHLALARDAQLCVFDERGLGNGWLLPAGPLREAWPQTGAGKPGSGKSGTRESGAGETGAGAVNQALHQATNPAVDWAVQITASDLDTPVQALPGAFAARRQLADHAVNGQGQRVPLASLQHWQGPLVAFAGIAKPEAFFAGLRAQGLAPSREIALGDHASALDHAELAALLRRSAQPTASVQPSAPTGSVGSIDSVDPALPLLLCTEKDAVKLWHHHQHPCPQLLAVPLQLDLPADLLAHIDARVDQLLTHRAARKTC